MAVTFSTGREVIAGLKKGSAWRTAVECGANDGILITSGMASPKAPTFLPDDSLGQVDIRKYYKTNEMYSDSLDGYLRYEGWDLALALALGTSAGAPANIEGDAYGNTYSPADTLADLFATLCMKKSPNTEGIWEIPSTKITGFTISARVGELAKISFNIMGNKIVTDETDAINDQTTVQSITYPDRENVCIMDANFKMRMNAQAGGALSDSDKIYPYGFTLTYNRPHAENYEAGYSDMSEPVQDGFSEVSLEINYDKYNLDTFMAAIEDETEYKLDILFKGALISGSTYYNLRIDFPKITWVTGDAPTGGPGTIPHNITGRCQAVSSAPTGMSGVVDPLSIYLINKRTTDPLA